MIKYIILALSLIFAQPVRAASQGEDSNFQASLPYLIAPAAGMLNGAIFSLRAGHAFSKERTLIWSAVGALVGVLDELMLHAELVKSLTFLPAFIGASHPLAGALFGGNGRLGASVGAGLGFAVSRGYLSKVEDYLSEPVWNAIMGYQAYGALGAVTGAGASFADFGLQSHNMSSEPYLSKTFKNALFVRFLLAPWNPYFSQIPGVQSLSLISLGEFIPATLWTAYQIANSEPGL